ncbi:hypothetical protein [Brassicibacter mesophilus]|uniref:hypothetical protein n=1 Tax=Brassicibacter mesophilus TaxID=745119 RepID=UPI003D1A1C6B
MSREVSDYVNCKVEGCNNKAKTNSLCGKHYAQYLRHNKVLARTRFEENEIVIKEKYAEIIVYDFNNNVKGKVIIDNEYLEIIKGFKIYTDNQGYATVNIDNEKLHLTEMIFGRLQADKCYSYKNKDKFDCRKENIEIDTREELSRKQKLSKKNKTGVKGVVINEGKYQAHIGHQGKSIYLGRYDTLDEAKEARITAEKQYWGKIYTKD